MSISGLTGKSQKTGNYPLTHFPMITIYNEAKTSFLPDAFYSGVIARSNAWSNPNGPNGIFVDFRLPDGLVFSYLFKQGFPGFDDLLALAGFKPVPGASFEEKTLVGLSATFETKINIGKNGSEYCNVVSVKPCPVTAPASNPNATAEELDAMNPFSDKKKA
jgi:hypothetical protein